MAERFPKRSILSVMSSIASANSGPQPPQSGASTESGKSSRRRPPQPQNSNGEIPTSETATFPPQTSRSRSRAKSPAPTPAELSAQDFLSNPQSAINPRKPKTAKTTKIGEAKSRQPRKKGLAAVDMFAFPEPNSPVSTRASNPISEPETTTPPPARKSRASAPPESIPDPVTAPKLKKAPVPKPRPQANQRPGKRSATGNVPPLVYATRLLILGVGMAVICGTLLSVVNAVSRSGVTTQETPAGQKNPADSAVAAPATPEALQLNQEIAALKTEVQVIATENATLTAGIFLVDLDTGSYVNFNGDAPFASASTIKVPILVAFFQAVDEGKIQLDQVLTLKPEHIVGGSGDMQDDAPGEKYSALEVAKKMIVVSDNTATNMMVELLGGAEVLNQQFANWGLRATVLHNKLPDLEGTNTSSPKDLINIIAQVDRGNLVSVKSRDRILQIMRQTKNDSLLPRGLGEGAVIAHKTGNINTMLADAGMVDLPNGKRYLVAVMVKHPPETEKPAQTLIRDISKMSYRYLNDGETPAESKVKIKN
ncbi:MAG: serine hydrolase [Microcoleus sp. PH2017_01_SCD_O_A]|uniref:serine hydrolase n=2 Tax=unclassified Microcoleus TaxID=2642155 RepID=UPI001DD073E8|nr:serine hydrolase [Microcoleus sp. PH2017_18_LLB_O_A]MCC3425245.1 serine hydrolase [Microcoleus sp. PH2017_01_SCD_O_A]MCC3433743.1 serine hydrolase [Microcoleus sp. PH2017_04_SCI_O_A]MCC3517148.1 serine hydrolase [Microcoleus sp. PH2017_18_LLB_O_A]TAG68333.1 MAG: serine hydrolase [Oscillatoriales cyanobacterium]